jgi:hypothetical protein
MKKQTIKTSPPQRITIPSSFVWEFVNEEKKLKIALEKAILLNYIRIGINRLLENKINSYKIINGKSYPCIYNTAEEIMQLTGFLFSEITIKRRIYELEKDNKIISTVEYISSCPSGYQRKFYSLPIYNKDCSYEDFVINAFPLDDSKYCDNLKYKSNVFTLGTLEDQDDYNTDEYDKRVPNFFESDFGTFAQTSSKIGLVNTIVAEVLYNLIIKNEGKKEDKYNITKDGRFWRGISLNYLKENTKLNLLKMTSNSICKSLDFLHKKNLIMIDRKYCENSKSDRYVSIPDYFHFDTKFLSF